MTPPKKGFKTTDEYISSFPQNVQAVLQQVRQAIKEAAPQAQEVISYNMPAFKQKGILVWFAAFKNHIGFFPKVSAMDAFKEQLAGYQTSKGTLRFPLDKPMPIGLIEEIVKFRVKEDQNEK
ncbi:MAG: iron chaperone [Ignavibacteria bacterium]